MPWPAGANIAPPIPEEGILFHVQPVSPLSCEEQALHECSQIRQYTEERGLLEFDLYIYSKRTEGDLTVLGLDLPLAWPETWELVSWEWCHQGVGRLERSDNLAQMSVDWPTAPPMQSDNLFLAGRFILDVPDCGWFGIAGLPTGPMLRMGCQTGDVEIWWAMPGWAQAGVECGHCYVACDLLLPCRPVFTPKELDIHAARGTVATAVLQSLAGKRCLPVFTAAADWLALQVGEPVLTEKGVSHEITAVFDTRGLDEGVHETWIRGSDDCVECVRVLLTVDPPPPAPAPAMTWGRVKEIYR